MKSRQNNPEKSYTERKAKHELSGYYGVQFVHSMQGKTDIIFMEKKDCIENFCGDLKELATGIINCKEKK